MADSLLDFARQRVRDAELAVMNAQQRVMAAQQHAADAQARLVKAQKSVSAIANLHKELDADDAE